ncbi:hypothetical protein GEM21_05430 [Salmonella enterica]|nr:hypothetical protein [Salmonella enterica]EEO2148454.1 hypothetical protein [Salmonella enterica]EIL8912090.1 hypothetical protein [Salmonella enterica]
MPKIIDLGNGQNAEFPDNMSDEQIAAILKKQYTQETPQPPEQSLGEQALDTVKGMGRIAAGVPVALANAGIGVINTAGNAVNEVKNFVTGENSEYHPIPEAGYGALDKYVAPRGVEKIGSEVGATILAAPVLGAEMVASEGAPILTRLANSIGRNAAAAVVPTMANHTSGKDSENALADLALNTVVGAGAEGGLWAAGKVAKPIYNALRPQSMVERAATAAPDYAQGVYQGGDEAAQAAYRTATTDEAGNVILNPSQVFDPESAAGKRFIREEQRSRATGTASPYEQNVRQQASGQSFERAVNEADTGADLQATSDTLATNFKTKANELYNTKKAAAQDVLDSVRIKKLNLPETRKTSTQALDDHTTKGVKLNRETRSLLNDFNKSPITSIDVLDNWKRSLNEAARKAYKNGDTNSGKALTNVVNSLRDEADTVINAINPDAGSLYRDADTFFRQSVGEFGPDSLIGKIADTENPVKANNIFLGANSLQGRAQGALNTNELTQILDSSVARGDVSPELAQQMRESLGNVTRSQAFDFANTNAQFNPSTFANRLHQYRPQAEAAGSTSVNNALRQAAELTETRATAGADFADSVGDLAARGVFTIAGGLKAGPAGAMSGNFVGGKVADFVPRLIDKISGTAGKSKALIDFVSDPANAEKVVRAIEARGGSLESATPNEVANIVGLLTRYGSQSAQEARREAQSKSNANPLPKLESRSQGVTGASTGIAEPVPQPQPEQHAQAAKAPERYSPDATRLYRSLASAETGNLKNRFIRTRAEEAGLSTAYGPSQLTVSTAKRFFDLHPDLLNSEEQAYLKRFIEQGERMKTAPKNDPVFGYGKAGTMGDTPEDRHMYAEVVQIMLDKMIKDNGGDKEKTMREWRYGDVNADIDKRDPRYAKKVRQAWRKFGPSQSTNSGSKSWGKPI